MQVNAKYAFNIWNKYELFTDMSLLTHEIKNKLLYKK